MPTIKSDYCVKKRTSRMHSGLAENPATPNMHDQLIIPSDHVAIAPMFTAQTGKGSTEQLNRKHQPSLIEYESKKK